MELAADSHVTFVPMYQTTRFHFSEARNLNIHH